MYTGSESTVYAKGQFSGPASPEHRVASHRDVPLPRCQGDFHRRPLKFQLSQSSILLVKQTLLVLKVAT